MKKLILSILLILLAVPAYALVTYNCTGLTGGATRDLDYLSVDDLSDGDRALVKFTSGVSSYLGMFEYDSSGTTTENTTTHPYYVRPDDYSTAGVWAELPASWVDIQTALTLTDLTVTGTVTVNDVNASGEYSGKIPTTDVTVGSTTTLSGVSRRNGNITNTQTGAGGATVYVSDGEKGDHFCCAIDKSTQVGSSSGASVWVTWANTQSLTNQTDFLTGTGSGTSAIFLSGATGSGFSAICVRDDTWRIYEDGNTVVSDGER